MFLNSIVFEAGRVEFRLQTKYNTMVSIRIRDDGRGMAPNIHKRIWEPFFTTKEVGTGVGLGLVLTYNTIKRYGGEILLKSRIGEGSQFTVLLTIG